MDFEQIIGDAIARQLLTGYTFTDQYGGIQNRPSPLQDLISGLLYNKSTIKKLLEGYLDKEGVDAAVCAAVKKQISEEWTRKVIHEVFLNGLGDKLKQKIGEELGALLAGKEISVSIK